MALSRSPFQENRRALVPCFKLLNTSDLPRRKPLVMVAVPAGLSAWSFDPLWVTADAENSFSSFGGELARDAFDTLAEHSCIVHDVSVHRHAGHKIVALMAVFSRLSNVSF